VWGCCARSVIRLVVIGRLFLGWRASWIPGSRRAICPEGCGIFDVFGRVEDCGISFMGVFDDACFICREIIRKFRSWRKYHYAYPFTGFCIPS